MPLSECVFFRRLLFEFKVAASQINSAGTSLRVAPQALSEGWSVVGVVATCIYVDSGPPSAPLVASEAASAVGELVSLVPMMRPSSSSLSFVTP